MMMELPLPTIHPSIHLQLPTKKNLLPNVLQICRDAQPSSCLSVSDGLKQEAWGSRGSVLPLLRMEKRRMTARDEVDERTRGETWRETGHKTKTDSREANSLAVTSSPHHLLPPSVPHTKAHNGIIDMRKVKFIPP